MSLFLNLTVVTSHDLTFLFHYLSISWLSMSLCLSIRDDVKLAQLVRAQDCQSRGRRFVSDKNSKTEKSNLHGSDLHRPLSKGTKILFQVIKAIINQWRFIWNRGLDSLQESSARHLLHLFYMYASAAAHQDFFRAWKVSYPDTWAHSGTTRWYVVCVCVHGHTHRHKTHRHPLPPQDGKTYEIMLMVHIYFYTSIFISQWERAQTLAIPSHGGRTWVLQKRTGYVPGSVKLVLDLWNIMDVEGIHREMATWKYFWFCQEPILMQK